MSDGHDDQVQSHLCLSSHLKLLLFLVLSEPTPPISCSDDSVRLETTGDWPSGKLILKVFLFIYAPRSYLLRVLSSSLYLFYPLTARIWDSPSAHLFSCCQPFFFFSCWDVPCQQETEVLDVIEREKARVVFFDKPQYFFFSQNK